MLQLPSLISRWQSDPRFMDNVAAWRALPAAPANYADWPEALDARVIAGARGRGL